MKAPYLQIAGKDIELEQTYYTVNSNYPFQFNTCKAGNENNTISTCYFIDKGEAQYYKHLCDMVQLADNQIAEIKITHQNR